MSGVGMARRHKRGAVEAESQRARMQPFRAFHLLLPSFLPFSSFRPITTTTITTINSRRFLYPYYHYLYTVAIWTMYISF